MAEPERNAGILVIEPQPEGHLCRGGVFDRFVQELIEEFLLVGIVDVGLHRDLVRPLMLPVVPVDGFKFRGERLEKLPLHPGAVVGVLGDEDGFMRGGAVDLLPLASSKPEGVYPAGDGVLLERQDDAYPFVDGEGKRCPGPADDLSRGERPDGCAEAVALACE